MSQSRLGYNAPGSGGLASLPSSVVQNVNDPEELEYTDYVPMWQESGGRLLKRASSLGEGISTYENTRKRVKIQEDGKNAYYLPTDFTVDPAQTRALVVSPQTDILSFTNLNDTQLFGNVTVYRDGDVLPNTVSGVIWILGTVSFPQERVTITGDTSFVGFGSQGASTITIPVLGGFFGIDVNVEFFNLKITSPMAVFNQFTFPAIQLENDLKDKFLTLSNVFFTQCASGCIWTKGYDLINMTDVVAMYNNMGYPDPSLITDSNRSKKAQFFFYAPSKLQITSCEFLRATYNGSFSSGHLVLLAGNTGACNLTSNLFHPQQDQIALRTDSSWRTLSSAITGNTFISAGLTAPELIQINDLNTVVAAPGLGPPAGFATNGVVVNSNNGVQDIRAACSGYMESSTVFTTMANSGYNELFFGDPATGPAVEFNDLKGNKAWVLPTTGTGAPLDPFLTDTGCPIQYIGQQPIVVTYNMTMTVDSEDGKGVGLVRLVKDAFNGGSTTQAVTKFQIEDTKNFSSTKATTVVLSATVELSYNDILLVEGQNLTFPGPTTADIFRVVSANVTVAEI